MPRKKKAKLTTLTSPQDATIEQFPTGAIRRKVADVSRTDLIPIAALEELGMRYHYGATIRGYGERNWEKGIPYSNLLQHMQVHLQLLCHQLITPEPASGWTSIIGDSPAQQAAAIMWGAAAIIHFLHHGNPAEKK